MPTPDATIPGFVLDMDDLPSFCMVLFARMRSYRAENNGTCDPDQSKLAVKFGVSRKTISEAIGVLKDRGLLTIERRGLNRTNVYILADTPPPDVTKRLHQDVTSGVTTTLHQDVTSGVTKRLHPGESVQTDVTQTSHPRANPGSRLDLGKDTDRDIPVKIRGARVKVPLDPVKEAEAKALVQEWLSLHSSIRPNKYTDKDAYACVAEHTLKDSVACMRFLWSDSVYTRNLLVGRINQISINMARFKVSTDPVLVAQNTVVPSSNGHHANGNGRYASKAAVAAAKEADDDARFMAGRCPTCWLRGGVAGLHLSDCADAPPGAPRIPYRDGADMENRKRDIARLGIAIEACHLT